MSTTQGTDDTNVVLASVVIPTYNSAHCVNDQLDALAQQDFPGRFEVVVADNGSTDGLAATLAARHDDPFFLRLVSADGRRGVSHARNVGLAAASSDLVCICDADDMVTPSWLRLLTQALQHFDLVGGGLTDHPDNRAAALRWRDRTSWNTMPTALGVIRYPQGCNVGLRRGVGLDVGGWDEDLVGGGDDVDFAWRVKLAGGTIGWVADALVQYRLRDSLHETSRQSRAYARGIVAVYVKHRGHGLRRRNLVEVLGSLWWLVSRLPLSIGAARRGRWVVVASRQIGMIEGSIRHRVLFL